MGIGDRAQPCAVGDTRARSAGRGAPGRRPAGDAHRRPAWRPRCARPKDRVRVAIQCAQLDFPNGRITVNLAPADLPKDGGRYDLAIALGILAASGQLANEALAGWEFVGELAPDRRDPRRRWRAGGGAGRRRRRAIACWSHSGDGAEAALATDVDVRTARTCSKSAPRSTGAGNCPRRTRDRAAWPSPDLADVRGRGACASSIGDRRRRLPPPAVRGAARQRQDLLACACAGSCRNPPTPKPWKPPRASASGRGLGPARAGASARSGPAPHRQRSRYRRRRRSAPGRDLAGPPRRAVPRRAPGMEPARAGRSCASLLESGSVSISRGAALRFPGALQLVAAMTPPCGWAGDPPAAACATTR